MGHINNFLKYGRFKLLECHWKFIARHLLKRLATSFALQEFQTNSEKKETKRFGRDPVC